MAKVNKKSLKRSRSKYTKEYKKRKKRRYSKRRMKGGAHYHNEPRTPEEAEASLTEAIAKSLESQKAEEAREEAELKEALEAIEAAESGMGPKPQPSSSILSSGGRHRPTTPARTKQRLKTPPPLPLLPNSKEAGRAPPAAGRAPPRAGREPPPLPPAGSRRSGPPAREVVESGPEPSSGTLSSGRRRPTTSASGAGIYNVPNAGNRCFSNALFQCLVKCRSLMDIIRANRDNYSGVDENVIRTLIQLLLAFSGDEEFGNSGENIEQYYTNFIDAYMEHTIKEKMRENSWSRHLAEAWVRGKLIYSVNHPDPHFRGALVSGSPPLLSWSLTKGLQDSNELLKNLLDILEEIPGFKEITNLNINITLSCMRCEGYRKDIPKGVWGGRWPPQLGIIEKKNGSKISAFFNTAFKPKTLKDQTQHCYVCNQGNICNGHSEKNKTGMVSKYRCIEVETEEGYIRNLDIIKDPETSEERKRQAKMELESYTHRTSGKVYGPTDLKPGQCHKAWKESYDVQELPRLLIIDDTLLKRFEDDFETGGKIVNRFSMDIERYLNIDTNTGPVQYQLSGFIVHSGGKSLSFGHYIAFVKGNDDNYYRVNDMDCQNKKYNNERLEELKATKALLIEDGEDTTYIDAEILAINQSMRNTSQRCNNLGEHYHRVNNINGAVSNGSVLFFYEKV